MDGGRVRLREPRKGRTSKGRKKFAANWREPRLFIIYAVDENGRMADDFAPIIDGILASSERLFKMLQACLASIKITKASRMVFVARWAMSRELTPAIDRGFLSLCCRSSSGHTTNAPESVQPPIITVGNPITIVPPWAVRSPIRAAGIEPISTVIDPFAITSGGPTQTAMSPTLAAGAPPISVVIAPGGRIGPPTCGIGGTLGVTIGQTCISPIRAAGGIILRLKEQTHGRPEEASPQIIRNISTGLRKSTEESDQFQKTLSGC